AGDRRCPAAAASVPVRLQTGHAGVRVLPLQEVVAAVDRLVVLGAVRAGNRAEVPGALVAVLVAGQVVPGVQPVVRDLFVVLVADDVDRRMAWVEAPFGYWPSSQPACAAYGWLA